MRHRRHSNTIMGLMITNLRTQKSSSCVLTYWPGLFAYAAPSTHKHICIMEK